jgi:hypothetical protein
MANTILPTTNNDQPEYLGYTLMTSSESLSDNDWVYDTGACESMAKQKDSFTNLTCSVTHECFLPRMGLPLWLMG